MTFRIGGDGFRSPTNPTERIRYCPVDGRVSTADFPDGPPLVGLCDTCCEFLGGVRPRKPGYRQRYLDTAKRHGITPS